MIVLAVRDAVLDAVRHQAIDLKGSCGMCGQFPYYTRVERFQTIAPRASRTRAYMGARTARTGRTGFSNQSLARTRVPHGVPHGFASPHSRARAMFFLFHDSKKGR
jgi:hypothetical protein